MNWQSAIVDVALIAAVVAISYLQILPPEYAQPLLISTISGLLAARAALAKPPGDGDGKGGGGAAAGSGALAVLYGLAAVLGRAKS